MKRIKSIPLQIATDKSIDEIKQRLDEKIEKQNNLKLYNMKGSPLFIWERNENEITVKYYHSYKKDFCDTMYRGRLTEGLSGCQLVGEVVKPKEIWIWFFSFTTVAAALLISFILAFVTQAIADSAIGSTATLEQFPLFLFAIPFVYLAVYFLVFEKNRLKILNNELRDFMSATDVDVLGEELEDARN